MARIWDDFPIFGRSESEKKPLTPAEEVAIGVAPGPVAGTQTFAPGISTAYEPAEEVELGIAPGPVSGVQVAAPGPAPSVSLQPPTPAVTPMEALYGNIQSIHRTVPYQPAPIPGLAELFAQGFDFWPEEQFEELDRSMDAGPLMQPGDLWDTYSGPSKSVFDWLELDVRRETIKQAVNQDMKQYAAQIFGDNTDRWSSWNSIFESDPVVAAGILIKEDVKKQKENLIAQLLMEDSMVAIAAGLGELPADQKTQIMVMAMSAALDDYANLDSRAIGQRYVSTLMNRYGDAIDTINDFGGDVLHSMRINAMHPEDRRRYRELEREIRMLEERRKLIESQGGNTDLIDSEIAWRRKDMASLVNRARIDNSLLVGTSEIFKEHSRAHMDAKMAIDELATNPSKYEQLVALNEEKRNQLVEIRALLQRKEQIEAMHGNTDLIDMEIERRMREYGFDRRDISMLDMRLEESFKKTEFEKTLAELLKDSSKSGMIAQDPIRFLALHFKYLTPEEVANALGLRGATVDYIVNQLQLAKPNEPFVAHQRENPFWIDPFKTPLHAMAGAVEDGLVAVGVPDDIASVASHVAVLAPMMVIGSTIGGPTGLAVSAAYYGGLQTVPTVAHHGISRESLIALADFGTTMAIFSPTTYAIEDAITRQIIAALSNKGISSSAIRYGAEAMTRAGLNIAEDVPATAVVLAVAGVDPSSKEFSDIMRDIVVFNAALGVAMPLAGNYFRYGIPELGTYATAYVAGHYVLGMEEEDARKAAVGLAVSVGLARHNIIGKSVIAAEKIYDIGVSAVKNIAGTAAARSIDAVRSAVGRAAAAELPEGVAGDVAVRSLDGVTSTGKSINVAPRTIEEASKNTEVAITRSDGSVDWKPDIEIHEKTSFGVFNHIINVVGEMYKMAGSKLEIAPSDVIMMLTNVMAETSHVYPFVKKIAAGNEEVYGALKDTLLFKTLSVLAANGNTRIPIDELHRLNAMTHGIPIADNVKKEVPYNVMDNTVQTNKIVVTASVTKDGKADIGEAVVIEMRDVVSPDGRVYRMVDGVQIAEGVSPKLVEYALKQALLQAIGDTIPDGFVIGVKTENSGALIEALRSIEKTANVKVEHVKKTDSYVLEWKNVMVGNSNLRNILADAKVALTPGVKAFDYRDKAFSKFEQSFEEKLAGASRDIIMSAIPSVALYVMNEYIDEDGTTWDNAKLAAIVFGFGLTGSLFSKVAAKTYTAPGAKPIHDIQAESIDVMYDRFVKKQHLSIDQRIGNMIRRWIGNVEMKDMPLVAAAAQDLRRAFKQASSVADHYQLLTHLIIKELEPVAKINYGTGHIVTSDTGRKVQLLDIKEEIVDGNARRVAYVREGEYATLQDIAARLPLYEELAAKTDDASLKKIISAAKEIRSLIEPITRDLYNKGILEEGRIRQDILLDYNGKSGFYLPRGRVVGFEDGAFVVGSPAMGGFRKAKPFWKKTAEGSEAMGVKAVGISEDLAYVPIDVAIREFTQSALQNIATKAFAEIIIYMNDVADAKLFEHPENRIPEDLREEYFTLRNEIDKIERQIKSAQRIQDKMARTAARIERVLPNAHKRLQELQAKIEDKEASAAEKIYELRETVTALKHDIRAKFKQLRDAAAKEAASDEQLKMLRSQEREYIRELNRLESKLFGSTYKQVKPTGMGIRLPDLKLLPQSIETILGNTLVKSVESYKTFMQSMQALAKYDESLIEKYGDSSQRQGKFNIAEYNADIAQREVLIKDVLAAYKLMQTEFKKLPRKTELARNIKITENKINDIESFLIEFMDYTRKEFKKPAQFAKNEQAIANLKDVYTNFMEKQFTPHRVLNELHVLANRFTTAYQKHLTRAESITDLADQNRSAHDLMVETLRDLGVETTQLAQRAQELGKTTAAAELAKLNERIRIMQNDIKELEKRRQHAVERGRKASEKEIELLQRLEARLKEYEEIEKQYRKAFAIAYDNARGHRVNIEGLDKFIFDPQVAGSINKYLNPQTFGVFDEIINAVTAINNLWRSMQATGDASFFGVTGLLAGYNFPNAIGSAFKSALADAANPTKYLDYVRKYNERARADHMPTVEEWEKYGLHLSGIVAPGGEDYNIVRAGQNAVERAANNLQELPGIRHSNILYTISGNIARLEIARNLYLAHVDPFMTKAQRLEMLRGISESVNKMTGFTDRAFGDIGGGTGAIAPMIWFASRWTSSQFAVLFDAASKPDIKGAKAREALLRMVGVGGLLTVLANEALGNETEFDPRDANFMKIRIGDYDISLFGPWDSLVRGIIISAQGLPVIPGEGDPTYFFRSKLSPVAGTVVDISAGQTVIGEPIDNWYALRKLLPFSVSGIARDIKLSAERGESIDRMAINSIISVLTGVFGIKASPLSEREYLEKEMRRDGVDPDDPLAVKKWKLENPDRVPVSTTSKMVDYYKARDEYRERMKVLEERFNKNEITMEEWLSLREQYLSEFLVITKNIFDEEFDRKITDNVADKRNWISAYFAIYDVAKDKNGNFDQRVFDKELTKFIDKYGEDALNYVYEFIDLGRDSISNERARAVRMLTRLNIDGKIVNYFEIPRVRPEVLQGKNSWVLSGPLFDDIEYQKFLENIIDYVEEKRQTGSDAIMQVMLGRRRAEDVKDLTRVDQGEPFAVSLQKLWNDIAADNAGGIMTDFSRAAVYNDLVYYDVLAFKKQTNRNPLIDQIREKYPYETRIFDKGVKKRDLDDVKRLK